MIVLLYDPYSLRGLLGSHGQNRFTIGAFFCHIILFRKAAKKLENERCDDIWENTGGRQQAGDSQAFVS